MFGRCPHRRDQFVSDYFRSSFSLDMGEYDVAGGVFYGPNM